MNLATYTRALAAGFLNVHRKALARIVVAADAAAQKAADLADKGAEEIAAAEAAVREMRVEQAARRKDVQAAIAAADATTKAVGAELALLPFKD